MSKKEELHILWGLVSRINNMINGYKPRGRDYKPRRRKNNGNNSNHFSMS